MPPIATHIAMFPVRQSHLSTTSFFAVDLRRSFSARSSAQSGHVVFDTASSSVPPKSAFRARRRRTHAADLDKARLRLLQTSAQLAVEFA